MASQDRKNGAGGPAGLEDPAETDIVEHEEYEDEATTTPFDHPLFLPVILAGFALWFFYDGFFNPNIESVMFNRICFVPLALAAGWTTWRGLREMREIREAEERQSAEGGGPPPS